MMMTNFLYIPVPQGRSNYLRPLVAHWPGSVFQVDVVAALGVGPGDEVITQAFTFVATVESIIEAGATPIIADPSTKTCKCLFDTSFPIALAAVSLSLIALIIRPQGENNAFCDNHKKTSKTTENRLQ